MWEDSGPPRAQQQPRSCYTICGFDFFGFFVFKRLIFLDTSPGHMLKSLVSGSLSSTERPLVMINMKPVILKGSLGWQSYRTRRVGQKIIKAFEKRTTKSHHSITFFHEGYEPQIHLTSGRRAAICKVEVDRRTGKWDVGSHVRRKAVWAAVCTQYLR